MPVAILEVATGLVFVYLLAALVCSVVNEWIAAAVGSRSKHLEATLQRLIDNQDARNHFFAHPLIAALYPQGKTLIAKAASKPSYIPAKQFVTAVLDTIDPQNIAGDLKAVVSVLDKAPNLAVAKALSVIAKHADGDLEKFRRDAEQWYDDVMERLSGWYKRRTQVVLILLAVITAACLNIDSIHMAKVLYLNPVMRTAWAKDATNYMAKHRPSSTVTTRPSWSDLETNLQSADAPIGWQNEKADWRSGNWCLSKLLGILISCAAISLGAPFWFDTLNLFMNFRSAVKPPKSGSS